MRLLKEEDGNILVLTALSLTCLLGFAGLACDTGYLLLQRRNAQLAADCAAVEGALEVDWATNDSTTVSAAAKNSSAQNGFTDGSNGVTVTVNNGPASGPHSGDANFVEVIVQRSVPTFFMQLLNRSSVTVSARSVAGPGSNAGCVYTLGTTGTDLSMSGSDKVTINNCTMYIDSSDASTALSMSGSASLVATGISIVGGYTDTSSGTLSPTPNTGQVAVGDPLAFLPAPTLPGSCNAQVNSAGSITYGCYDGISLSGSEILSLGPGLYYINGDLTTSGSSAINGTNVTLYVTGKINVSGSGALTLTAPTSAASAVNGAMDGILLFQSRTVTSANATVVLSGSSGATIGGIIYAPKAAMTLSGSSGSTINSNEVVKTLTLSGSATLGDYNKLNGESPLQSITLSE